MQIYRVVDPVTNHGPFVHPYAWPDSNKKCIEYIEHILINEYSSMTHPAIINDMRNFSKGLVVGCKSLSQLRHWFNYSNLIDALHDDGYIIRAYDTDLVYESYSRTQVAFDESLATITNIYPVTRLKVKGMKSLNMENY
jgi:hypothetical protein